MDARIGTIADGLGMTGAADRSQGGPRRVSWLVVDTLLLLVAMRAASSPLTAAGVVALPPPRDARPRTAEGAGMTSSASTAITTAAITGGVSVFVALIAIANSLLTARSSRKD